MLQHASFEQRGPRRQDVLLQIERQILHVFDSQRQMIPVQLVPVPLAGVEAALALLQANRWAEGRLALEALDG